MLVASKLFKNLLHFAGFFRSTLVWGPHDNHNGYFFTHTNWNVHHIHIQLYHEADKGPPDNTGKEIFSYLFMSTNHVY